MTQGEFNAAATRLGNNVASVVRGAVDNQAVAALEALPEGGPGGAIMSVTGLGTSLLSHRPAAGIVETLSHGGPHLLRGVYAFQDTDANGTADAWVRTGDSDELILRWTFTDEAAAGHDAELIIDWDVAQPTELVNDGTEVVEAPTDMNASLSVDGGQVANADFDADWYDAPACPNPVMEATSMDLTGFLGEAGRRLEFEDHDSLDDTAGAASTQGQVTATAGGDTATFDWNVSAQGSLTRGADCFIESADVSNGSADLGLSSVVGGDEDSIRIAFDFDNIAMDEAGNPVSADVTAGEITVNGEVGVTFAGTLDDSNGNDVPGENLIVTFREGQTRTLESIIQQLADRLGSGPDATPAKAPDQGQ